MKRFSNISFAIAALFAVVPLLTVGSSPIAGQDITITIKKGDKPAKTITIEDADKEKAKPPFKGKRPAVDVAILLDTSNSMDGLISQAKAQLWKIVQEFATAEKSGMTPKLRVSVFEYGNSRLPANEGYIRQVVSLTDDLDVVSESLFGLSTKGGDEYCGMVIDEALTRLDWSKASNAYKAIFIAGNEPFTQGSVQYKKSCRRAIESGVVVNTIHCGEYSKGVSGKWKDGADLAEGEYMNINQDRKVARIKTPQDKIIIELNNDLNKTYLWFGEKQKREGYKTNQYKQDSNAWSMGGFGRGGAKASGVYDNRTRDLIDNLKLAQGKEGKLKALNEIDEEALPGEIRKMSEKERLAYVEKMTKKRTEIQKKIVEATTARTQYLADVQRKFAESGAMAGGGRGGAGFGGRGGGVGGGGGGGGGGATLGDAMTTAVRKQLETSGFDLKKK